jgi:tetratricopeptide (TPR) repeat protein
MYHQIDLYLNKIYSKQNSIMQELNMIMWPCIVLGIISMIVYFYLFWDIPKQPSQTLELPSTKRDQNNYSALNQHLLETKYVVHKLLSDGIQFEEDGKIDSALENYLACLYDYKSDYVVDSDIDTLLNMSECLKRISHIYVSHKKDYGYALQFILAEKFIYEQALVSVTSSQTLRKKHPLIQRSEALHKLSDLCFKESKYDLAAEYATKAHTFKSKIPRDELSSDAKRALSQMDQTEVEQFTKAYVELGKQSYEQNVHWYQAQKELNET